VRESSRPVQSLYRDKPMFSSRFMPCPDCGASLDLAERDVHTCLHDRWLEYEIFRLRDEIAQLESQLRRYLASPRGRFETWYAERRRERRPPDDSAQTPPPEA
jgi:hypothetical protein